MYHKTTNFRVRANEIDVNSKLTFHNLVNYFQEAAWLHVIDLNITVEEILKYDLLWALSRMKVEVFEYPKLHETVTVKTFISGFDKYFFYRDLGLYNENDELIAQATSTWLLVNVKTRRLAPVPPFLKKIIEKNDVKGERLPLAKGKITKIKEPDFQSKIDVKWFNLDMNNHVNHIYYFRWILEELPTIVHKTQTIKSVDIIIKSEALLGEILTVQAIDNQDDSYTHQILNEDNKIVVQAVSTFR